MVGQEHRADPKPIVDLNRCCDAVHLTPEIDIHQQQVGLMLACCEESILPRDDRSDEHVSKCLEDIGEAEATIG